ncbi:MAG TPA: cytosine methyltransferase [Prolixibacteraceae bacterium]|nr:cytosine methyltransferase [Prolixibacteraceae bacterium]
MDIKLFNEDCFETIEKIPDNSISLILTDMPYGLTKNKWDVMPYLKKQWMEWERIIDINGVIVCTAAQPFTSMLVMSNLEMFKYEMIWEKPNPSGFLNCKKMPLKDIENVLVFYDHQPTYNPQGLIRVDRKRTNDKSKNGTNETGISSHNGGKMKGDYVQEFTNYPRQVLRFKTETGLHPTQKPVSLMEYIILTYTNEGDTVFDGYSGSGTTAIACINTNRKFIGSELNDEYYQIAKQRISQSLQKQTQLF